jgi:hypothetical protein
MGIIRAGILSRVSGKVAGVVGGSWKDKAYLREYVIPANPNTTPQQTQRSKMRIGVAFAKPLVGQVFNHYTDRFERGMSGFNRFIMDNMALFLTPITFNLIKMTNGKLWGVPTAVVTCAAGDIAFTFTAGDIGNNGHATDKVYSCAYDATTGIWYFQAAELARSFGVVGFSLPASTIGHVMHGYVWAAKYSLTSPTLLEMISNSTYGTVVSA